VNTAADAPRTNKTKEQPVPQNGNLVIVHLQKGVKNKVLT